MYVLSIFVIIFIFTVYYDEGKRIHVLCYKGKYLVTAQAPASEAPFACGIHCYGRHGGKSSHRTNVDDQALLRHKQNSVNAVLYAGTTSRAPRL